MNRLNVNLLDLPNEILFYILEKLNNTDVLYLLFDINNEQLESIVRDETFSNTLNFASIIHNITNIDSILDRFCNSILPQIHYNVKYLIVTSTFMERIFLAAHYPCLTQLKLLDFQLDRALHFFTDNSPFRHTFTKITKLNLINQDMDRGVGSSIDYTKRVYVQILSCFDNLEHLNIIQSSVHAYPGLFVRYLPPNVLSSTLTYLCVNVGTLTDCLCLLDGRLKQLTTLIVRIYLMDRDLSINSNMDDLPHLKCFSLIHHGLIKQYDNDILPLLRRMLYLEKLTLYLCVACRDVFIDPIYLLNEFIMHMSQLNSFNFYFSVENNTNDLVHYLSNNDVKRNIGHQEVLDMVSYFFDTAVYQIFTLPFEFDILMSVGNIFPNIVFNDVTELWVHDVVPFEHEFFQRILKAFPLLKNFHISCFAPISFDNELSSPNIEPCEIIEYPHLTYLDLLGADINCVEQFLNENITRLPCLSGLRIMYEKLRIVTNDFTREATRCNCLNVKRLTILRNIVGTKEFHTYFPLL